LRLLALVLSLSGIVFSAVGLVGWLPTAVGEQVVVALFSFSLTFLTLGLVGGLV